MSDDFDDEKTPERAAAREPTRQPTDSERRRHAAKWASRVPVVDDPAHPPTGRSHWTEEQRVAAGAPHRRAMTDSERRRARNSQTMGQPVATDHIERELGVDGLANVEEITAPWTILDREELTPDEAEIVRRSRRDSSDPASYADIVKLTSRLVKQQLDERSAQKQQVAAIRKLIAHPPHEAVEQLQREVETQREYLDRIAASVPDKLDRRLEALEGRTKLGNRVLAAAALAVTGALVAVADRIWNRAEHEGETTIRLQYVETAVKDLKQDLRDSRSDRSPRPYSPADQPHWLTPPQPPKDLKP